MAILDLYADAIIVEDPWNYKLYVVKTTCKLWQFIGSDWDGECQLYIDRVVSLCW
jgi:hypothetical protein